MLLKKVAWVHPPGSVWRCQSRSCSQTGTNVEIRPPIIGLSIKTTTAAATTTTIKTKQKFNNQTETATTSTTTKTTKNTRTKKMPQSAKPSFQWRRVCGTHASSSHMWTFSSCHWGSKYICKYKYLNGKIRGQTQNAHERKQTVRIKKPEAPMVHKVCKIC